MKQKKNYIITHDFKSPYVMATGIPHNPNKILFRRYKKGQIVTGVLIEANGKPAYVLSEGYFTIPLSNIKEMVTKDVSYSVEGDKSKKADPILPKVNNPKLKYMDAVIIGGIVGAVVVFIAQKRNWIAEQDHMYKAYGAGIGAALGLYVVYRKNNKNKMIQQNKK
jgi:hypothetical protein